MDLDTTLEPHVFVDGPPSKTVPCVRCGRPCLVHAYAATKWVKCFEHRPQPKSAGIGGQKSKLDPLELGLDFGELQNRLQGRKLVQRVVIDGIEFEQEHQVGYMLAKGKEVIGLRDVGVDGSLHIIALDGGHRWIRRGDIVGVR